MTPTPTPTSSVGNTLGDVVRKLYERKRQPGEINDFFKFHFGLSAQDALTTFGHAARAKTVKSMKGVAPELRNFLTMGGVQELPADLALLVGFEDNPDRARVPLVAPTGPDPDGVGGWEAPTGPDPDGGWEAPTGPDPDGGWEASQAGAQHRRYMVGYQAPGAVQMDREAERKSLNDALSLPADSGDVNAPFVSPQAPVPEALPSAMPFGLRTGRWALGVPATVAGAVGGAARQGMLISAQAIAGLRVALAEEVKAGGGALVADIRRVPGHPMDGLPGLGFSAETATRARSRLSPVDEVIEPGRRFLEVHGPNKVLVTMDAEEQHVRKQVGKGLVDSLEKDADQLQGGVKMLGSLLLNLSATGQEDKGFVASLAADFGKGADAGDAMMAGTVGATLALFRNDPVSTFRARPLMTLLTIAPFGGALGKLAKTHPEVALVMREPSVQRVLAWSKQVAGAGATGAVLFGDATGFAVGAALGAAPKAVKALFNQVAKDMGWNPHIVDLKSQAFDQWVFDQAKGRNVSESVILEEIAMDPARLKAILTGVSKPAASEIAKGRAGVRGADGFREPPPEMSSVSPAETVSGTPPVLEPVERRVLPSPLRPGEVLSPREDIVSRLPDDLRTESVPPPKLSPVDPTIETLRAKYDVPPPMTPPPPPPPPPPLMGKMFGARSKRAALRQRLDVPGGVVRSQADEAELFLKPLVALDAKAAKQEMRGRVERLLAKRGEYLVDTVSPWTGKRELQVSAVPNMVMPGYYRRQGGERVLLDVNREGRSAQIDPATREVGGVNATVFTPERMEPVNITSPQLKRAADSVVENLLKRVPEGSSWSLPDRVRAVMANVLLDDSLYRLKDKSFRGRVIGRMADLGGLSKSAAVRLFEELNVKLLDISENALNAGQVQTASIRFPNGKIVSLEQATLDVVTHMRASGYGEALNAATSHAFNQMMQGMAATAERGSFVLNLEKQVRRWDVGGKRMLPVGAARRSIEMWERDKELPPIMNFDPVEVAKQVRRIGDRLDDKGKKVHHELAEYLETVYEPHNFEVHDLLEDARKMSGSRLGDVSSWAPGTKWATKAVNRMVDAQLKFMRTSNEARSIAGAFEGVLRRNVVTRSPAAHANNFGVNWMIETVSSGNPLVMLDSIKMAKRYLRYTKGELSTTHPDFALFDFVVKTGMIDSGWFEGEMNVLGAGGWMEAAGSKVGGMGKGGRLAAKMLLKARKALNFADESYKFGDTFWKVRSAMTDLREFIDASKKLAPGESMTFTVRAGRKVDVVRAGEDAWKIDGKMVDSKAVKQVMADAAVEIAQSKFFDYLDVPVGLKRLKASRWVAFAAPFLIYPWKSLDVPGYKQGLGSVMLGSSAKYVTTSPTLNLALAAKMGAVAIRRQVALSGMRALLIEQPEILKDMLKEHPEAEVISMVLDAEFNPLHSAVQVKHFYSGSVFNQTKKMMNVTHGVLAGVISIPEPIPVVNDRNSQAEVDAAKRKADWWVRHRNGIDGNWIADSMSLVGLEGGMSLQLARALLSSKSASAMGQLMDALTSKTAGTLLLSRVGVTALNGLKESVKADGQDWGLFVRDQLFGMGLKDVDLPKQGRNYMVRTRRRMKATVDAVEKKALDGVSDPVKVAEIELEMAKWRAVDERWLRGKSDELKLLLLKYKL